MVGKGKNMKNNEFACDIDLSKIPIEDLKDGYKDFREIISQKNRKSN